MIFLLLTSLPYFLYKIGKKEKEENKQEKLDIMRWNRLAGIWFTNRAVLPRDT